MQLFIMRHGEASFDALTDRQRVLTPLGKRQVEMSAKYINEQIQRLDLILVSPYIRTQQTLLACQSVLSIDENKVLNLPELEPDANVEDAINICMSYAQEFEAKSVLIISHLPLVNLLVDYWIPLHQNMSIFNVACVAQLEMNRETQDNRMIYFFNPYKQIE